MNPKESEAMNPNRGRTSEWSEGERSVPKRNGEVLPRRASEEGDGCDTEVLALPKRRRFTAAYKAKIVREAAACTQAGEIGALLRREGLFSSQLAAWRSRYARGEENALQEIKRGRKPKQSALEKENERLRRKLQQTEKKLSQANLLIDLQKKMAELLGLPITEDPNLETVSCK